LPSSRQRGMLRGMKQLIVMVAASTLGFVLPSLGADDGPDAHSADELKARLRLAGEHVRRFELHASDEAIELISRPLLAFNDPARPGNNHGTLWAWGTSGRPVAFMKLFRESKKDAAWFHSVTLTSSQHVVLVTPESGRWEPPQSLLKPSPISDAPPPVEKAPARSRQLKDLARRFSAHEFWDPENSRFEMRVLAQPVNRYSDVAANIQDGAAFIIAHGTNPEAVLLIEALGPSIDEARWHYGIVRSCHAEAHVEFDGREVWRCDRAGNGADGPDKSYWLFVSP
jgi:hypothetical protein